MLWVKLRTNLLTIYSSATGVGVVREYFEVMLSRSDFDMVINSRLASALASPN